MRIKIILIMLIRFARIFKNSRRGLLRHSNLYDREGKRSSGHPHNISCHFSFIRIVPYRNIIFFIFASRWHLCKWRAERKGFFIWHFLREKDGLPSWLSIEIIQVVLPLMRKKRFFVGGLLTSMTSLHFMKISERNQEGFSWDHWWTHQPM